MSRAELARALAALVEGPDLAEVAGALELSRPPTPVEHTQLFDLQLYPYASVHLGPEGQLGGVARDRVAGFLRALGVVPPAEPDHLAVLLAAYAELIELDGGPARVGVRADAVPGAGRARHARTVLLHEHLWSWVPRFTDRAAELGARPYRQWAGLLRRFLADEVAALGPPPGLPAPLRDAPGIPDPRDGGSAEDLLAGLLAPVRAGVVLTRADLARAATALGLGLRIGERAFVLRALIAQDAPGTLRFLAAEALRQRESVRGDDATAGFWVDRLETTAGLLDELARTADAVPVAG